MTSRWHLLFLDRSLAPIGTVQCICHRGLLVIMCNFWLRKGMDRNYISWWLILLKMASSSPCLVYIPWGVCLNIVLELRCGGDLFITMCMAHQNHKPHGETLNLMYFVSCGVEHRIWTTLVYLIVQKLPMMKMPSPMQLRSMITQGSFFHIWSSILEMFG